MTLHYITTTSEPPLGGRAPTASPAPPKPEAPPAYTCNLVTAPGCSCCGPTEPHGHCLLVAKPPEPPKPAPPKTIVCHPIVPVPAKPKDPDCSCCTLVSPPVPKHGHRVVPADTSNIPAASIHAKATVLAPPMCLVHLIQRGHHPWNNPYTRFDFTLHEVPPSITIKELIEVIRPPQDPHRANGIIEAIEMGDGKWMKGTHFHHGDDTSKQTLVDIGWSAARGRDRKPVWIAFG